MATFEESIIYPIILLLIGAFISTTTTSWMTMRSEERKKQIDIELENRRKELEIKVDITSKMAAAIAQLDAEISYLFYRRKKLEKEEMSVFFQNVKKSYIEARSIHSKLEGYFPDNDVPNRWDLYYDLLSNFCQASLMYFDQVPVGHENLRHALDYIKHHLSYEKSIDWENFRTTFDENQWLDIQIIIRREGDELIKDILRLPIKIF